MARVVAKKPKTSLAFQDDQELMTPGPKRDHLLHQIQQMGGKWVRANVLYGKTNGGRDLTALDGLVNAAKARGIKVQATLMSDPQYLQQQGALNYRNNDPKLWAQFAKTVAEKERGRVGRYSVGNEMNYPAFVEGADKNPRQAGRTYRNVYRAGRKAIKTIDPKSQVLFGEMTNMKGAQEFMKGALGGKRLYTDGFAYHPYDGNSGAWDTNNLGDLQRALRGYKGKLQTVKGKQAPLYLTEYGKHAGTGDSASRAKQVAAAYERAKKAGAREFLQYQLTSKQGQQGAGYGATAPGAVWDTSIGTQTGDLSALANALKPKVKVKRRR